MENDLEVIKKIREKEDQENKATQELKDRLKKELDQVQKESEEKISATRKKLASEYGKKMESTRKKMEELREQVLSDAESRANSVKLQMSDSELRDLVAKILKEYLEA